MFAADFFSTLIYEFRTPPASKRTRAINAQRELGEVWADIANSTDAIKRLAAAAPKKFISENATLGRPQSGEAVSDETAQQKFVGGMANAISREEIAVRLHRQVIGSSK